MLFEFFREGGDGMFRRLPHVFFFLCFGEGVECEGLGKVGIHDLGN